MTEHIEHHVRRVLVAVDPCRQNLEALHRALTLAERLRAEFTALFVEDENLLHLAGLPFTQEVHRASAVSRRLDTRQLARTLRIQAENLRRTVVRNAEERKIQASVQVVRGQLANAALAATLATDVLFLNVHNASKSSAKPARCKPVWVMFDASVASVRALRLAGELCDPDNRDLTVLLPAANPQQTAELRHQAAQILGQNSDQTHYISLDQAEATQLIEMIQRQGCSLLVLHRDSPLMTTAQYLLEHIQCPIVLIG